MKIIFLGTCSGKTSLNRFHSALLFSYKDYNLLIDTGDGISRSLLKNKIDFNSIDGILLTHLHPDHFAGLPGLIIQMKMTKRKKPLYIFIHKSFKSLIRNFLLSLYILPERMDFEIHYITFDNNEKIKIRESFFLIGRKNSHLNKLESYIVKYPSISLYSGSFLFEVESKKVIYTSDIGSEEDLALFSEIIPDILITEFNHISPTALLKNYKLSGSTRIFITHYSDEDLRSTSDILASQTDFINEKLVVANDGQIIEI